MMAVGRFVLVSLSALAVSGFGSVRVEPAYRQAFVRGEEAALYRIRLVNGDAARHEAAEAIVEQDLANGERRRQVLSVGTLEPHAECRIGCPIETRLKPGWRMLAVTVRNKSGATVGEGSLCYGIGPAVSDRGIPLFMSHYDFAPASAVADFGFTHAYNKFAKPQEFLIPDPQGVWAKGYIRTFDEAVMCGLRLTAGMDKTEDPDGAKPGEGRCRTRDGQVAWNPRHTHELPDVADPKMVDAFRRLAAAEAEIFGEHPAFVGLLPCTEQRDFSFPDFGTGARLFREATGLEIPAEVRDGAKGRSLDPEIARTRYPDGIVPEDDPVLRYYRWFWSGGDGWPGYVGAAAAEYKKRIKRPDFVTYWNPAVRCPPRWGSGGEVDMIDHWCYAEPEPMNVAGVAEEMFAMAAGRPGQKVSIKTQLITYRQQTAPVGKKVSPEPEWLRRLPGARFPTIAPDILSESTWSMFAKPVDVFMYHGWGTVWNHHGKGYYDYTCPASAERLRHLVKDVLLPLGPAMKLIGRAPSPVAVFESFTSAMMSGAFSWGWKAPVVTMLQRARLDPRVVYEETIVRDGLEGVKVLVAPQCKYLTQDIVGRIRAFQAKGGILVADAELVGALKADIVLPTVSFDPPPESDSYEDVGKQERARNGEEKTHQATRRVKERLIAVGREARKALSAKYVPAADSSSPELVTYARRWKDVDYLFVVNDRRTFGDYIGQWGLVMEKGLPMSGEVTLADPEGKVGAVYELSRGGSVEFSRRDGRVVVPVSFETTDGRVFAFLRRPVARLEAEASETVTPGEKIVVTLRVVDAEGRPVEAVLPVDVRVFDAEGRELDGAGYAAVENGSVRLEVQTNLDDPAGDYRVVCRERASGRSCECLARQNKAARGTPAGGEANQ